MYKRQLYAYSEEVKEGYLTIEGGHRIGMAGQVVKKDGKVTGLSHITFLNVRIAHEKRGCADDILPHIRRSDGIYNTPVSYTHLDVYKRQLYGPFFDGDKMRVRIFNPDGSEAEKSGNGIRIFSKYLKDMGYVTEAVSYTHLEVT